jgi:flagellar motility protein MotE (MotC chaperone)
MKSGYDQFFIKAKENSQGESVPKQSKYAHAVSKKRAEKNKNKKSFPIMPIFSFAACILAVFLLIEKFDDIESYISKIEIGLGTAQAETTPAAASEATKADGEVKPVVEGSAEAPVATVGESKEDNADYLFKLAERKKELDAREEDLNKKAAEINKQKIEIEAKLKQLEESRDKIAGMLKERIASDSGKVDNLVQVYSNMKPVQAAKVFETMDEDLVIEILGRMKKKNAADILNLVKIEKAQKFSERYAGYRTPASANNASEDTETNGPSETQQKP